MTSQIILINLNRYGDIFQSAHLLQSFKEKDPTTRVHYVCYEEVANAANILADIDVLHTIPRKKIISFSKNPIYSDGLAFDALEESLSNIKISANDLIINYSNDRVSTYISTYLARTYNSNVAGISFSPIHTVEYSNSMAVVLNDVLPVYPSTPYNFNDCYHSLVTTPHARNRRNPIKIDSEHSEVAKESIYKIKCSKNINVSDVKIIGIQLCSSTEEKDIPQEALVDFLSLISEDPYIVPLLLVSPSQEEKDKADKLNELFNNTLVSVESDFKAIPSVLSHLDLLVTPDTSIKHLADLLRVNTLEVSLGFAPFLKQGTVNTNSMILTLEPSVRDFKESTSIKEKSIAENQKLHGADLYNISKEMIGQAVEDYELSPGLVCYKPIRTADGSFLLPLDGDINQDFELRRVLSRSIIQNIVYENIDLSFLLKVTSAFDAKALTDFIYNEKKMLAETSKHLLSALRELIQLQEKPKSSDNFIKALEGLLSHCHQPFLSTIPVLFFRAKLETVQSTTLEENLKEVEKLIYRLKQDIKLALQTLDSCEQRDQTQEVPERSEEQGL